MNWTAAPDLTHRRLVAGQLRSRRELGHSEGRQGIVPRTAISRNDLDVHSVVHGPTQTTSTRTVALRSTWDLRRLRQPVRHDGPGRYRLLRLQGGRLHATGILAILALPSVQGDRLVLHMLRRS